MAIRGKIFVALLLALTLAALTPAFAAEREQLGDAWWTGPLQTPSPNTIPKNHWYVETYFAVEQDNGVYSNGGTLFGANSAKAKALGSVGYDNDYQSTTLMTYGVTNKFNFQMLLGVDGAQGGTGVPSSNGVEVNTLRIRLPYNVLKFKQGGAPLSFAIVPEVNTPMAAGAIWTPGVGFWVQRPFWMPGGRILRVRASEDIWFPKSGKSVTAGSYDAAKYGVTQVGLEYSLTKHWVPAWDFVWKYYGQNQLNGVNVTGITGFTAAGAPIVGTLAGRRDFRVDPALEYNFTENTGIIFGVEVTVAGKNTGSYIAPQIALQWFK